MYICPTCNKEIDKEEIVVQHYLKCWKEKIPHHQVKSAPRSADINTREVNDDVINFFNSLQR